jgi:hypothetical protein
MLCYACRCKFVLVGFDISKVFIIFLIRFTSLLVPI